MVGHVVNHYQTNTQAILGFIYGLVYIFNEAFPLGEL